MNYVLDSVWLNYLLILFSLSCFIRKSLLLYRSMFIVNITVNVTTKTNLASTLIEEKKLRMESNDQADGCGSFKSSYMENASDGDLLV